MTEAAGAPEPGRVVPLPLPTPAAGARIARRGELSERLLDNIEKVVKGKREQIKLVLCALLCEGHVLLEDVP
ncbi:MAG: hypothetical protein ACXVZW_01475, partial [Gaiellaceae bacterium]